MSIGQMIVSAVSVYTVDGFVSALSGTTEPSKSENCSCDYTESRFYQDHGCCEYCYFVGE